METVPGLSPVGGWGQTGQVAGEMGWAGQAEPGWAALAAQTPLRRAAEHSGHTRGRSCVLLERATHVLSAAWPLCLLWLPGVVIADAVTVPGFGSQALGVRKQEAVGSWFSQSVASFRVPWVMWHLGHEAAWTQWAVCSVTVDPEPLRAGSEWCS